MKDEPLKDFLERMATKFEALEQEREDMVDLIINRIGYVSYEVIDNLRQNISWIVERTKEGDNP